MAIRRKIAFSLTCQSCDAGDGFPTQKDAKTAGWIDIGYDDGPSWNYIGHCPNCQLTEAKDFAADLARSAWNAVNPAEWKCNRRYPDTVKEMTDAAGILERLQECGKDIAKAEANVEKLRQWRDRNNMPAPLRTLR